MSFLIYLIHPAEQQTKPGRSLLHVHNPRHLWHLGHAGCRHLCKGSRFIFDEFVKIPLLWLRFCFFDIKTSGGRHFAWVQLQQAPWNYLWWWLLAWGSGLCIFFLAAVKPCLCRPYQLSASLLGPLCQLMFFFGLLTSSYLSGLVGFYHRQVI